VKKSNQKRELSLKTRNRVMGEIACNDPTRFRERIVLSEDEKLIASRARRKENLRREKDECTG